MLKDILNRIENLHDFITKHSTDETLTILEKDIILQNLRDIYLLSHNLEIGLEKEEVEEELNDSERVVVFEVEESEKEFSDDAIIVKDIEVEELGPFSLEERKNVENELFGGSSEKYNEFFAKLDEFDDFDEAIIFISESFPDKQSSPFVEQIAVYVEKLNY